MHSLTHVWFLGVPPANSFAFICMVWMMHACLQKHIYSCFGCVFMPISELLHAGSNYDICAPGLLPLGSAHRGTHTCTGLCVYVYVCVCFALVMRAHIKFLRMMTSLAACMHACTHACASLYTLFMYRMYHKVILAKLRNCSHRSGPYMAVVYVRVYVHVYIRACTCTHIILVSMCRVWRTHRSLIVHM
jgi:hypothetical protein